MPRTISEMIERHRRATGETFDQMSIRSRRAGRAGVGTGSLNNFAKSDLRQMPRHRETYEGLAAILGVSELTVVLAFARELGIDVGSPRFGDLLPPAADGLPDHALQAVNNLIRSMLQMVQQDPELAQHSDVPNFTERDISDGDVRPGRRDDEPDVDDGETGTR